MATTQQLTPTLFDALFQVIDGALQRGDGASPKGDVDRVPSGRAPSQTNDIGKWLKTATTEPRKHFQTPNFTTHTSIPINRLKTGERL